MAEPKAKKKQFTRKKPVNYDRIRFTVPELFEDDAVFNLPSARQVPLGIQRKLSTEPGAFENWMVENVAGDDVEAQIEAIDSLVGEETQIFAEAWRKASKVDAGKSRR